MIKRNDNPKLKIVVMSASLDVNKFRAYFDNCPMIEVSGRTNEVKELFLEDFVDSLGNSRKILEMETNEELLLDPIVKLIFKVGLSFYRNI